MIKDLLTQIGFTENIYRIDVDGWLSYTSRFPSDPLTHQYIKGKRIFKVDDNNIFCFITYPDSPLHQYEYENTFALSESNLNEIFKLELRIGKINNIINEL